MDKIKKAGITGFNLSEKCPDISFFLLLVLRKTNLAEKKKVFRLEDYKRGQKPKKPVHQVFANSKSYTQYGNDIQ